MECVPTSPIGHKKILSGSSREGIPDKYDGPLATQIEGYRRLLKLINVLVNAGISLYNVTIGKLPLAVGKKEYIHSDHEAKNLRNNAEVNSITIEGKSSKQDLNR